MTTELNAENCRDDDGYQWFREDEIEVAVNPRSGTNQGWTPERMTRLRGNIQREGLKQRLEVRIVGGTPRLVAGGRRLQCIRTLKAQNALVYNRNTRKMESARKVYANLCCLVTECSDDKEAMRHAVAENLLHEHLSDYDLLIQCQKLEACGHSRTEQAKVFDKSEAWVSQTHSLLAGNPKILEAMAEGVLGRTQALRFLNVSADKVEAVLTRSILRAKMELEEREQALLEEQDKTYDELEECEEQMLAARAQGLADVEAEAKKKLRAFEETVGENAKKLKKLKKEKNKRPTPSLEDIEQAAQDEKADEGPARHMPMKTLKQVADKMSQLLSGGQSLVNPATNLEYSMREFRIVRDVCDCILRRNSLKTPLDALNVDLQAG